MMRIARYLPAAILLALVSCGDSAIFLAPAEEPAEVRIETILPGEVVAPAAAIPLRVAHDPVFTGNPETADRLVVELLDTDGVLLGEQIYESVDQAGELPPLLLPDIGEGLFVLRTSYYDGDDLIETDDVPFFIAGGEFALLGLSSFPATLYPGSAGLLSLNLGIPVGSNPYLEWFLDDDLVQGGYLFDTGSTMEIRAPDKTGVYTVSVKLYPVAPEFGEEPIPAPVSHDTELIVSTESVLDQGDFTPERNYFVLHHFLGDLRDSGARSGMVESVEFGARAIGDPSLAVESDTFGYRLDGNDGFELDGFTLPVRDGELSPFSLSFRIRPDILADITSLVDISVDAQSVVHLEVDGDGFLNLDLGEGNASVRSNGPVLQAGTTSAVTVSVLPIDEQTLVQFYVDGVTVLSEIADWDSSEVRLPEPISSTEDGWMLLPGTTRIAGESGFYGIMDEFGVYFRDDGDRPSADTGIFHSAMEQIYGEKLVFAEGFEADELPEMIRVAGAAGIETGRLVLGDGAIAFFPLFGFSSEELAVTVSLEALPGSLLRFYSGESDTLIAEILTSDLEVEGTDLKFRFTHSDARVLIDSPDGGESEVGLEGDVDFVGIRLEVSQSSDEPAEIAVESVVAWREYPEIPATLLQPREDDLIDSVIEAVTEPDSEL